MLSPTVNEVLMLLSERVNKYDFFYSTALLTPCTDLKL